MRVLIVHDAIEDSASPDVKDALVQADAVSAALSGLGHESRTFPVDLDLWHLKTVVVEGRYDIVFNLMESLCGKGRLIHLVPEVLAAFGVPFTGSPAEAMRATSNKILAKRRMAALGLPTPGWIGPFPEDPESGSDPVAAAPRTWIVKSLWEHASIGMDAASIHQDRRPGEMCALLGGMAEKLGGACFAERYIDGREFNISLLAGPDGPQVLPAAEILFENWSPEKPKIVDYAAKWDEDAHSYQNTSRHFVREARDAALVERLGALSRSLWAAFGLSGYARVDFRVNAAGNPWILEVNANPCLSPDAGFAAALQAAGIPYKEAIQRILDDAGPIPRRFLPPEAKAARRATPEVTFRASPKPGDEKQIRELVSSTGFFSPEEVAVAGELVTEGIEKGSASGYHFLFAEKSGRLCGYACFGPIPMTQESWDLYWIAVHPAFQGRGLGGEILLRAEAAIFQLGGQRIYVETSLRDQYQPTRRFYERAGYDLKSLLEDFYRKGDGKATYVKRLEKPPLP